MHCYAILQFFYIRHLSNSLRTSYVVDTIDEIESVIKHLQQHPEELDTLAEEAIKLAKSFDWKVLVKDWEKVIEELYYNK